MLSIVSFSFSACNSDNSQEKNNKSYESSVSVDISDRKSENSLNGSVSESFNSESKIAESSIESSAAEQPIINPLENKIYSPLSYNENDDFDKFFSGTIKDYSKHISEFKEYTLTTHLAEIKSGKGFSDFNDYESSFDGYYSFMYGVANCNISNVPKEYSDAWDLLKTTVINNKSDIDALYHLKGDDLFNKCSEMSETLASEFETIGNNIPSFKSTEIKTGDTIKLDFVEMSVDTHGVSDTILPTDTSSAYSYISDVENEKYFFIKGTIKNLSGSTYDVEDMVIQMVFDDKYTYNGSLSACAFTNDFFGENVKPLGKVEYYIHSSVPDELIESYKNCTITFAFKTDFAGSKYSLDLDECEYKYKLNISK